MSKSTITDLPAEIEALIPEAERTPLINQILAEARAGEFHDYRNEKYVCGKIAVCGLIQETGDQRLLHIIAAVKNGVYDEQASPEDLANLKKDWMDNGGTEESFTEMFGEE